MIVDRLFAAAELRLGGEHQKKRPHRPHRREAAVVTDAPHDETAGPPEAIGRHRKCGCAPAGRP